MGIDIEDLTEGRIVRIWYCPPVETNGGVLLIEPVAGPKTYQRIGLDFIATDHGDWTWRKPDDAVLLVGPPAEAQ